MQHRQRIAWIALGLFLATTATLFAVGQGRLLITIVDQDGKPVVDAEVVLRDPEGSFERSYSTNKKGRVTVTVLDATIVYEADVIKDGYLPLRKAVKAPVGDIARPRWTLVKGEAVGAGAAAVAQLAAETEGSRQAVKLFQEGAELYRGGKADEAMAKFKEGVEIDPEMVAGHAVLARLYFEREDRDSALASANRALELDSTNVVAREVQYDVLLARGEEAAAEEALAALVEADQGKPTAVRVYNSGVALLRKGNVDGGAARLEQALEISPDLPPAYPALANIYKQRGQPEKVLELADRLAGVDAESVEIPLMRYEAHQLLGNQAEAEAALAELKQKSPGKVADSLYNQGREMFNAGDSEGAVRALEQAIGVAPDHAKALYLLGLARVNLGRLPQAKEALDRFLELAPEDPDAQAARDMVQYIESSG